MVKIFGQYHSYAFVDKDPIIDYIRTVIKNSNKKLKDIADESGVTYNTIRNWMWGDTKRPQAASINAVLRVCNYKLDITKIDTVMIIQPTPYSPKEIKPIRNKITFQKRKAILKKSIKKSNVKFFNKYNKSASRKGK